MVKFDICRDEIVVTCSHGKVTRHRGVDAAKFMGKTERPFDVLCVCGEITAVSVEQARDIHARAMASPLLARAYAIVSGNA